MEPDQIETYPAQSPYSSIGGVVGAGNNGNKTTIPIQAIINALDCSTARLLAPSFFQSTGRRLKIKHLFMSAGAGPSPDVFVNALQCQFPSVRLALAPDIWYRCSDLGPIGSQSAWDSSGNGNHGNWVGTPVFGSPAVIPLAATPSTLYNVATPAVIQFSGGTAAELGPTGSLAFAFHAAAPPGAGAIIMSKQDTVGGFFPGLFVSVTAAGLVQCNFDLGTGVIETLTGVTNICDGNPHLIHMTWAPGARTIYVDGGVDGADAPATDNLVIAAGTYLYIMDNNPAVLGLGVDASSHQDWAIWNDLALTAGNVAAEYAAWSNPATVVTQNVFPTVSLGGVPLDFHSVNGIYGLSDADFMVTASNNTPLTVIFEGEYTP